jgi:hypothetical protein
MNEEIELRDQIDKLKHQIYLLKHAVWALEGTDLYRQGDEREIAFARQIVSEAKKETGMEEP